MGKVKTTAIRNFSDELMEKLPNKFSTEFRKNKEVLKELDLNTTKKSINKIAGYITHEVKKRKQKRKEMKELAKRQEQRKERRKEVPVTEELEDE